MKLSRYQLDIDDFILTGRGNLVVNAVAGAGKSTQIRRNVKMVSGRRLLCAFNKHIADENATKIGDPAVDSKTMHGLGYGAIAVHVKPARVNVQEHKYHDIAKSLFDDRKELSNFVRLTDLVRVSLVNENDDEAIWDLVNHHGLAESVSLDMVRNLGPVLKTGRVQGERGVIDFTDMIWLPVVLNMRPRQYDWVFCDELQDLSPCQAAFVTKLLAKGGRFVGVGDPHQSIYGFAGADANSFYNLKEAFDATELPLSITYRCPKAVVRLAQRYVPHLEAREDAPEGAVVHIQESELADKVVEGDLILCRLTAPLIKQCIKMIGEKVPARVRGREIGAQLTGIVKKVDKRGEFTMGTLQKWFSEETDKLAKHDHSEAAIEALTDKVQGIIAIFRAFADGPDYSVDEFCADILSLFSDQRSSVILSTVHKAKGLEEMRVFILKPSKLPFFHPSMTEWQLKQEENLAYVAYTRAMGTLFIVDEEGGDE